MKQRRTRFSSKVVLSLCLVLVLSVSYTVLAEDTISVWVGDGDVRLEEYKIVAALFEAQNPGIKVDLQLQSGNQTQVMEKLALAIAGGAPPDVTWIEGSAVVEFAARGLLTDVTNVLKGLSFAPADVQEMTYNGKMWAVPYHTAVRGLFKRADFFEQAGLNPNIDPASLDELYDWNRKLTVVSPDGVYTRAGMMPWVGNWGSPAWIWTFGGQLLEIDGASIRPTANHPKNIEAFSWLRNWAQAYGSRTPVTGGHTGFLNGSVAMSMESTSSVGRFLDADVQFTTGRLPHPEGGKNGTWGGGTAVAVPAGVKNLDLAFKLARFFGETDPQAQRFLASPSAILPSNWQALMMVGRDLPKVWQPLLDQFPEARPRTPLWITYYVGQLNPAMNQVVAGTKTPEQALNDVQVVMEVLYQDLFGN